MTDEDRSFTVIDFGPVSNHYFVEMKLVEKFRCKDHDYKTLKTGVEHIILHCGICGNDITTIDSH